MTTTTADSPVSDDRDAEARRSLPADKLRSRIQWLLLFRTVIITVLLVTTIALRLSAGQPILGPASVILYGVAIASYATILIGALWLRSKSPRGGLIIAYLQLVGDSAMATFLVIATGGHQSAFVFLFSLAILNAAGVIDRRAAVIIAMANSALYLFVIALELVPRVPPLGLPSTTMVGVSSSVIANVLAFFLVAILSGSLTEQLRRASEGLDVARAELRAVGATHEAVLASLPSGVLTIDGDTRVAFLNLSAEEILGKNSRDVVGLPLSTVMPGVPIDSLQQDRFEISVMVSGGNRIIGGSVAQLASTDAGGRVVVFQDLTELRRLQLALARADRLQTVGRFAAGLAHEIRNPLAAMIGCLQLLRHDDGTLDADAGRMIDITHREAQRLSKLVTDFLVYARPAPPALTSISVKEVVRGVVMSMHTQERAAGAPETSVEVVDDGVVAVVDSGQLRQIMINLLMNASAAVNGELGALPEGREKKIRITVEEITDMTRIIVDDSGPGISPEDRSKIFVPFFTRRPSGTGLGLATCHQLAMAHGGELDLGESPLGGARFVLLLPKTPDGGALA